MKLDRTLVVVSYYQDRSTDDLLKLLRALALEAGSSSYDIVVVVNSTKDQIVDISGIKRRINVLYRNNEGMNIGAWNFGWRTLSTYDNYIFLQDECVVVKSGWLAAYTTALKQRDVGLIGESLSWQNKSWDELRAWSMPLLPGHQLEGVAVDRIEFYLDRMRSWGVDPGQTGDHVQALVWACRRATLEEINGFPEGRNKAECIAAEIAVSRNVVSTGKILMQAMPTKFFWFSHPQWEP